MRRRLPLALFFLGAGIMHFVKPGAYEATVPDPLPGHREIVYISGVAEIAGALALLDRRSAPWAGWWLIALLRRGLPRQREHGGKRGALPGGPGSAPVDPAADSGAAHRLGVARVFTTAVPISRPCLNASVPKAPFSASAAPFVSVALTPETVRRLPFLLT